MHSSLKYCLTLTIVLINFAETALAAPPPGYKLTWADEFDGETLDRTRWNYRSLGTRRDALNVPAAVSVADGYLTITTYTERGIHFTGMVGTRDIFEQTYGYWEARIDFNGTPGMWSAFWLQSPTMGELIGQPAIAGTEIDIQEHRSVVEHLIHSAVHWDGYQEHHQMVSQITKRPTLSNSGFHVYGLEWTPTHYRFYDDGELLWTLPKPISQRSQYIILSSEVENNPFWAGTILPGGYGSRQDSTTTMRVDWVRVHTRRN
ncbi:MAG: glycoside hydrolase family 16 protein [Elainellaceae cyanobacterium]